MTKKDYVLIARVLKRARGSDNTSAPQILDAVAEDLCGGLELDNPAFNRERFLSACGVRQKEKV
jgi:hypothetical protein